MKIAHVINPFKASDDSDLSFAQPITFESMRVAHQAAISAGINIELYSVQYPEDHDVIPDYFTKTADLDRSVYDVGTFKTHRRLPLLRDILDRLVAATDADFLIYTNSDIAVQPHFYITVKEIIDHEIDAFCINRRDISDHYTSPEQLPLMYREVGKKHNGYDCFIFRRDHYSRYQLGNICVGMPYIGGALLANMVAYAQSTKILIGKCLTFHIGNNTPYRDEQFEDYRQHNVLEYYSVIRSIHSAGLSQKLSDFFVPPFVPQEPFRYPIENKFKAFYPKTYRTLNAISQKLTQKLCDIEQQRNHHDKERREKLRSETANKIINNRDKHFISCITFPRSGHHLLVNLLMKYFSGDPDFPLTDGKNTIYQCAKVIHAGDFHYCAARAHCSHFGCTDPNTNFQKEHDPVFETPLLNHIKYIIQYRHPLESLVSLYLGMYRLNHPAPDFHQFMETRFRQWNHFVYKWVFSEEARHIDSRQINYHSLIRNPVQEASTVIQFIKPERQVNTANLENIIDILDIKPKNSIFDFELYDEALFRTMEAGITDKLNRLGIPLIYG